MFYRQSTNTTRVTVPLTTGTYKVPGENPDKKIRITKEDADGHRAYNLIGWTQNVKHISNINGNYHILIENKYGRFIITGDKTNLDVYEESHGEYIPSLNTLGDFALSMVDGALFRESARTEFVPTSIVAGDKLVNVNHQEWDVLMVCPDGALVIYGARDSGHSQHTRLLTPRDRGFVNMFVNLGVKQ